MGVSHSMGIERTCSHHFGNLKLHYGYWCPTSAEGFTRVHCLTFFHASNPRSLNCTKIRGLAEKYIGNYKGVLW